MRLLKLPIVCLLFISVYAGYTQEFKVHSHNDYKQNIPFWKALGAEVQSVEVDVFYKDGKLLVAHEQNEIQENPTIFIFSSHEMWASLFCRPAHRWSCRARESQLQ